MKAENTKKTINSRKIIVFFCVTALFVGICLLCGILFSLRSEAAIYATAVNLIATDGTQTVLTSDADRTEATYTWVAETATLSLNGYSGRSITANGDINLHLVGNRRFILLDVMVEGLLSRRSAIFRKLNPSDKNCCRHFRSSMVKCL